MSEIHVAVSVSAPFFVIVCVLPVNRGYCGHFPFTSDAVWFCKSLRWRLQKPFCKSCGYSRLKITAKRLFQNASSVKLQQKGTKKQPNVRLFGEFQHFPFTSDAVCFCKSLRWRLQKPFCKSCGYSRLKITAKRLFQNASSVKLQQKGTKKQPNVRLFGEFQHFPFTSDAVCFCKSLRWRLQKPFCKLCGYSRLKITVKYLFFKTLQVSNCNKRAQKNSRMFGCLVSFIFIYSVRTA